MTGVPEPVPLDPPPGDVGALEDVVEDVAGAAYWLTVLSGDLSGPAASAPGWLGDDAAAAAAQVSTVAGIARECSAAVGAAAHRLRLHHDLLRDVRRQVDALRAEQNNRRAGCGETPVVTGRAADEHDSGPLSARSARSCRRLARTARSDADDDFRTRGACRLAGASDQLEGKGIPH